jgi:hypothetical protein
MEMRGRFSTAEIALAVSALVALGGWAYQNGQTKAFESKGSEVETALGQIREIRSMKKVWGKKTPGSSIEGLRGVISSGKIERLDIGKESVALRAKGLDGRNLNHLLGKTMKLPLRFKEIYIKRNGDRYEMECQCKR